jgi:membrane associated rhomboid family serine protease
MKIKYNAPTTLTFAFISAAVMLLNQFLFHGLTDAWFSVGGRAPFSPHSIHSWVTLFTHIIGHADLNHLLGNFTLILLIGPILEAFFGSFSLFLMISITALVTGAFNILIFPYTNLKGASGVVFMMILLASFTNFNKGEIPLTFILILVLYMGQQIVDAFKSDNVSQFAHLIGGFCGSLFGFFRPVKRHERVVRDREPSRGLHLPNHQI